MSYGVSSRDSHSVSESPSGVIRKIAPAPGPTGTRVVAPPLVDVSATLTAVTSVDTLTVTVPPLSAVPLELSVSEEEDDDEEEAVVRPRTAAAKIEPSWRTRI